MIGAIIGDIVGSRFEFNNTDDLNFELFTDECSFTDDSICTLAIAYALVSGISYEESHTIGAIVGSIAEAIWGIPKAISDAALGFLPNIMASNIAKFYESLAQRQK